MEGPPEQRERAWMVVKGPSARTVWGWEGENVEESCLRM